MKLKPTDAVIVDSVRSAMGRADGGGFRQVRAEQLSADLIRALLARNPQVVPSTVDDLLWGCANQTLEQGANIARNALLLAGLPFSVPAQTINRLCGSSMSALHSAVQSIQSGHGDLFIVGGVEHMGHLPMEHGVDIAPALSKRVSKSSWRMGTTAEALGVISGISREAQDAFAVRSHRLAHQAEIEGRWNDELIPLEGHDSKGFKALIRHDEGIRADCTQEALAALPPLFRPPKGTVTAGNASALSDGSAALLVMSARRAQELGVAPKARVLSLSVVGCDPGLMGRGPVPATRKVLARVGLKLSDVDIIEINEAFAAQTLAVLRELDLLEQADDRVNLNGGAIALGHPFGASGARICTTLLHLLEQRDQRIGLAAMCVGLGQGVATLFERLD